MAANNNNSTKNLGASPSFGNAGMASSSLPMNHPSQPQAETHGGSHFPGASSPSLSTPGTASVKRVPQKPPARPPAPSNTNTVSPFKTMELTPAARRKKRKLPEKQLPDRVAALLPESALYTQLLEFEARLDASLARKKVDIQESLRNPPCVQKTLRIYVFNTFSNQARTIPEKNNSEPPSWSLKIIGRVLEDGIDPDPAGVIHNPSSSSPKFSTFFKRITISLDQRLYPDNYMIIWENARSPAPHEGFEEMSAFLANTEKHREIDACEEAICAAIKKIHEHCRRRAFFLGFSQSPVEFINALIASQSRDLKLVSGEGSRSAEKEHRSDFYNQPWVEDAVIRYLNRKPAAGSEAPGST
ncbi:hypothetical protein HHK36_032575 [Tetracentron sinense]|uniref:Uncharacterized protein n=1 Tax=Tetracentron sinense TaxID=13715 RepID=A0A835CZE8_TETSI|nr:hypothetical protein HHK36_032575 [Tetracentron sinense]